MAAGVGVPELEEAPGVCDGQLADSSSIGRFETWDEFAQTVDESGAVELLATSSAGALRGESRAR